MAIGWLTVLKSVPWTEVIVNAPKVADGAKKLWNSVGKKAPMPQGASAEGSTPSSVPSSAPQAEALVQIHERLAALEVAAARLDEQMRASSEVIKSLAEQNAQLIRGIEANRIRLRWTVGAVAVLGVVAASSLAWVWLR